LTFEAADLESEYKTHFYSQNISRWKRTIFVAFGILTFLYIYLVTNSTLESVEWNSNYHPSLKTLPFVCPAGYFW
jgi:hypothetical protein